MNDNPCEGCELQATCKHPHMQPDVNFDTGEEYADVMFIGEAPGAEEDDQGKPFVGRSGRLLRGVVEESGLDFFNIVYTNVVHCRPPDNKTPSVKQLTRCKVFLAQEIAFFEPRLIILLGNSALKAILGESGITNWRGVFVVREEYAIMPTLHPAYILRNGAALDDWAGDFEKAHEYISGAEDVVTDVSDEYEIIMVTDLAGVHAMDDIIYEEGICAWDTEVNGLRYGDKLVCMSFACYEAKKAWCVTLDDIEAVDMLKLMLLDREIGKIGHNIKFDWLAIHGNWGLEIQGVVGDSMLLSGMLDPTPGRHGLKNLAGRHLGMYDYNAEFNLYCTANEEADPKRGGDLRNVPLEILARYAALDAIATIEVHELLYAQLTPEQEALYTELVIPASDALAKMESNGILLDDQMVLDYIDIYQTKQDELAAIIRANKVIKRYIKFRLSKDKKYVFNPNSDYQMRDVLFDRKYFGLKSLGKTKGGKASTKWEYLKPFIEELPFLNDYRYYKLLGKMLSTYLRPPRDRWKDDDGRVRSDYKLNGTVTGRLSSSSPNLQNIPTPEKEPGTLLEIYPIKNIFTHTWQLAIANPFEGMIINVMTGEILEDILAERVTSDGCILAVDFSGMELRTMASVANCRGMIKAFADGVDVHSYVTEMLFGITREDFSPEDWKPKRYRAKWVNWTLLFGGSAHTLHSLYAIPMDEADRLVSTYYNAFPEVLDFNQATLEFCRENGYVESRFGRRRYMPYINDTRNNTMRKKNERAAMNMPIQSAASDVLICSLIVLRDQMQLNDFKSMMINTVHDSVMFDVYPGELGDLAWLCTEVMENLPNVYGPEYFPGLDFSWFTVPLKVDLEVGSHYGKVKHYSLEE